MENRGLLEAARGILQQVEHTAEALVRSARTPGTLRDADASASTLMDARIRLALFEERISTGDEPDQAEEVVNGLNDSVRLLNDVSIIAERIVRPFSDRARVIHS
jgi:hypothetical protein